MATWTQPGPSRRGSGASRSLNRVRKIFAAPWNDFGGSESSRQPVIPPAPLTGDVGCDRGDAGRTLLFLSQLLQRAFQQFQPVLAPEDLARRQHVARRTEDARTQRLLGELFMQPIKFRVRRTARAQFRGVKA